MSETEEAMLAELRQLRARTKAAQARRDATAAAEELPYERQRAVDMERAADLEAEHGTNRVWKIDVTGWTPKEKVDGAEHEAATLVMVRLPRRSESIWQRFQNEVVRYRKQEAKGIAEVERLARLCMAYPHPTGDAALYRATIELAPAAFTVAANLINDKAGGQAERDAGK